jgi:hypothetical protein
MCHSLLNEHIFFFQAAESVPVDVSLLQFLDGTLAHISCIAMSTSYDGAHGVASPTIPFPGKIDTDYTGDILVYKIHRMLDNPSVLEQFWW